MGKIMGNELQNGGFQLGTSFMVEVFPPKISGDLRGSSKVSWDNWLVVGWLGQPVLKNDGVNVHWDDDIKPIWIYINGKMPNWWQPFTNQTTIDLVTWISRSGGTRAARLSSQSSQVLPGVPWPAFLGWMRWSLERAAILCRWSCWPSVPQRLLTS